MWGLPSAIPASQTGEQKLAINGSTAGTGWRTPTIRKPSSNLNSLPAAFATTRLKGFVRQGRPDPTHGRTLVSKGKQRRLDFSGFHSPRAQGDQGPAPYLLGDRDGVRVEHDAGDVW